MASSFTNAVQAWASPPPGIEWVERSQLDPAFDELSLSLWTTDEATGGLVAGDEEAWRTVADVYVWGEFEEIDYAARPFEEVIAEIRVFIWNGDGEPRSLRFQGEVGAFGNLRDEVAAKTLETAARLGSIDVAAPEAEFVARRLVARANAIGERLDGQERHRLDVAAAALRRYQRERMGGHSYANRKLEQSLLQVYRDAGRMERGLELVEFQEQPADDRGDARNERSVSADSGSPARTGAMHPGRPRHMPGPPVRLSVQRSGRQPDSSAGTYLLLVRREWGESAGYVETPGRVTALALAPGKIWAGMDDALDTLFAVQKPDEKIAPDSTLLPPYLATESALQFLDAAWHGNLDTLKQLVADDSGGVAPGAFDLEKALIAARYGYADSAKALLARGANPNRLDRAGNSALHLALRFRHGDILSGMLDGPGDVNNQDGRGRTLLSAATEFWPEAVPYLLGQGANPDIPANNFANAVVTAAQNEQWDLVERLLDIGADVNAVTPSGISILQAAYAMGPERELVLPLLLERGAGLYPNRDFIRP